MNKSSTIALFGLLAMLGLIIVLQPAWLCEIANIGCKSGFARDCVRARGSTTEFTPSLSPSGESLSVHLGGKETITGAQSEKELELILDCVRDAYAGKYDDKGTTTKDDYITSKSIQLGLVEQQWIDGEIKLDLLEPADELGRDHLLNLAFGPAGGKRNEIMNNWCVTNSACVSCDISDDEKSYSVKLNNSATFEKLYSGTAPLSGHRKEGYQLVESDENLSEGIGRRVIFACASK